VAHKRKLPSRAKYLGGLIAELMNVEQALDKIVRTRKMKREQALDRLLMTIATDDPVLARVLSRPSENVRVNGEPWVPTDDEALAGLYRLRAMARRTESYLDDYATAIASRNAEGLTAYLVEVAWRCALCGGSGEKPTAWVASPAGRWQRSIPLWLSAEGAVALANEARAAHGDTGNWARVTDVEKALRGAKITQTVETRVRLIYNALAKGSQNVDLGPDTNKATKGRKLADLIAEVGPKVEARADGDTTRARAVTDQSPRRRQHGRHTIPPPKGRLPT
jgi:hypothetical protein